MNPEHKIKQLLDEADIATDDHFDQRLIDNACHGLHSGRRRGVIVVAVAACLGILLGGWWFQRDVTPSQPLHVPLYTQTSLSELMSQRSLLKAWQKDQMAGLNHLMDQTDRRSGQRPDRLTVDDVLNECDKL